MKHINLILLVLVLALATHPALAANTSGGGLPYESWLNKVRDSITGPVAFTISVLGIVAAGAALIFGGDMNGFVRGLIMLVLILALIIAAPNTLTAITGQGAEITTSSYLCVL